MTDCNRTWQELALVFDLLEGEEKRRLEGHLATCQSCNATVERLRRIEGRIREVKGALHATHPAPQEIYDYAAGPGAEAIEDAERSGALEVHFRRCRACSREVERIRALDRTASPIREVLRGEPVVPDAPPAPIPSIAQLMQTVERRLADDGAESEVLRTPLRPISTRRPRALVPAVAAAASIALALVLLQQARGSRLTRWVVASPGTHARRLAPEGSIPLRAGETLPADARIENPGPEPLVLVESTAEREPRLRVVEAGASVDLPRSPLPDLAIPRGQGLVAAASGAQLPTLRGIPEPSGLISPRLTVRERRPSFLFAPRGEGRRYRVACLVRDLTTGVKRELFTTPEGAGPSISYPSNAAALEYDGDHAFEWKLEEVSDGTVQSVGPVDFYLDPDPEPKRLEAQALRDLLPSSPAAGHFLAANHYLRAELYVDAMRELLASDPSLADEGVRGLFEKIARSLEVDLQAARALLAPPPR